MSEEKIQDLVSENLKVRVVLNDTGRKDGHAADAAGKRGSIDDRLDGARSAAAARRVEAFRQDALKVERKEYTYHYGRIFAACTTILSLLVVLIYFAYSAMQGSNIQGTHRVEAPLSESDAIPAPELVQVDVGEGAAPEVEVGAVMPQLMEEEVDSAPAESEVSALKNGAQAQGEAEIIKPVEQVEQVEKAKHEQVEREPLAEEEPQAIRVADEEAVSTASEAPLEYVEVEVFTDDVASVRMSGQISAREPVGRLPVEVSLGEPPFQTVYIFTTLNDRLGDRVVYRWSRNGVVQAEVFVKIRGQGWRSYSSKNINAQMTGDWTVELVDSEGGVLLSGAFKVVR